MHARAARFGTSTPFPGQFERPCAIDTKHGRAGVAPKMRRAEERSRAASRGATAESRRERGDREEQCERKRAEQQGGPRAERAERERGRAEQEHGGNRRRRGRSESGRRQSRSTAAIGAGEGMARAGEGGKSRMETASTAVSMRSRHVEGPALRQFGCGQMPAGRLGLSAHCRYSHWTHAEGPMPSRRPRQRVSGICRALLC